MFEVVVGRTGGLPATTSRQTTWVSITNRNQLWGSQHGLKKHRNKIHRKYIFNLFPVALAVCHEAFECHSPCNVIHWETLFSRTLLMIRTPLRRSSLWFLVVSALLLADCQGYQLK